TQYGGCEPEGSRLGARGDGCACGGAAQTSCIGRRSSDQRASARCVADPRGGSQGYSASGPASISTASSGDSGQPRAAHRDGAGSATRNSACKHDNGGSTC